MYVTEIKQGSKSGLSQEKKQLGNAADTCFYECSVELCWLWSYRAKQYFREKIKKEKEKKSSFIHIALLIFCQLAFFPISIANSNKETTSMCFFQTNSGRYNSQSTIKITLLGLSNLLRSAVKHFCTTAIGLRQSRRCESASLCFSALPWRWGQGINCAGCTLYTNTSTRVHIHSSLTR